MKPEEYLHTVTDQIRCAGARDMVEEELREHIRDQAEAYEAEGMFEEEALEKAVRDMGDPVETGVALDRIHRPHMSWGTLALAGALGIFGIVLQTVLSSGGGAVVGRDSLYWLKGHVRYTLMGMILMLAVYRLDYTVLAGRARRVAAVYLALLVMGTMLLGETSAGIIVSINIGIIRPSVSALLYLYIPLYGAVLYDYRGIGYQGMWKPFLWALVPVWISWRVPSLSAAMILLAAFALLFSVAVWHSWYRVNRKKTLAVLWGGMAALFLAWLGYGILAGGFAEYQVARIMAFLGKSSDSSYVSEMARQFLEGSTLVGGSITKTSGLWENLPGCNSDYVFVSLVTTFGILAGVLAAALIVYLIFRIFRIALRQKNQLGMILGCASGLVFLLQSVMHIMVNLKLIPAVAINLPFFSVGGSQLAVSYILLGIVLSVYRYKDIRQERRPEKQPEKKIRTWSLGSWTITNRSS